MSKYEWTFSKQNRLEKLEKEIEDLKHHKELCEDFKRGKDMLATMRKRYCEKCASPFKFASIVLERFNDSHYAKAYFGLKCFNPNCKEFRKVEELEGFHPNGIFREEIMVKTFNCSGCSSSFESLDTKEEISCPHCGNIVREEREDD